MALKSEKQLDLLKKVDFLANLKSKYPLLKTFQLI